VQGLAGGIFVPSVIAFIQLLFTGRARGRAFAIMTSVIGVSTGLGPIIGGLLIEAFGDEDGWRLVFGVNLPIGVIVLIAASFLLPKKMEENAAKPGIDWIGLLLLAGGLAVLLGPLIEAQDAGWPVWSYVSLAAGVLLIVVFSLWEVRCIKRGRSPLVPPRLFTHLAFTGGTVLALVYFAAFTSIFFTISLLWQDGLGHTALESGLVSVPFAVGSIVGASQSARLAFGLGRTVLTIGVSLVMGGLTWVWFVLLLVPATELTNWQLIVPLFLAGLGNGFFLAPNVQFIVATVDPSEAGAASGVIGTMQRIGSAVGIAVIGSVLFDTLIIEGTGTEAVASGFARSAAAAMGVSVAFSAVALLLVFVLPKQSVVGGSLPR
jgi:MFS family permease